MGGVLSARVQLLSYCVFSVLTTGKASFALHLISLVIPHSMSHKFLSGLLKENGVVLLWFNFQFYRRIAL